MPETATWSELSGGTATAEPTETATWAELSGGGDGDLSIRHDFSPQLRTAMPVTRPPTRDEMTLGAQQARLEQVRRANPGLYEQITRQPTVQELSGLGGVPSEGAAMAQTFTQEATAPFMLGPKVFAAITKQIYKARGKQPPEWAEIATEDVEHQMAEPSSRWAQAGRTGSKILGFGAGLLGGGVVAKGAAEAAPGFAAAEKAADAMHKALDGVRGMSSAQKSAAALSVGLAAYSAAEQVPGIIEGNVDPAQALKHAVAAPKEMLGEAIAAPIRAGQRISREGLTKGSIREAGESLMPTIMVAGIGVGLRSPRELLTRKGVETLVSERPDLAKTLADKPHITVRDIPELNRADRATAKTLIEQELAKQPVVETQTSPESVGSQPPTQTPAGIEPSPAPGVKDAPIETAPGASVSPEQYFNVQITSMDAAKKHLRGLYDNVKSFMVGESPDAYSQYDPSTGERSRDAAPEQSSFILPNTKEGRSYYKEIRANLPGKLKNNVRMARGNQKSDMDKVLAIGDEKAIADHIVRYADESSTEASRIKTTAKYILENWQQFAAEDLYAAYRYLNPKAGKGMKPTMVDPANMGVGDKFSIAGDKHTVTEKHSEYTVVKDGGELVVPVGSMIPADIGSFKQPLPPEPQSNIQRDMLGQSFTTPNTGSQRSMLFGGEDVRVKPPEDLPPAESSVDAAIRKQYDPNATPPLIGEKPRETIGLNVAENTRIREMFGLDELPEAVRVSHEEQLNTAKKRGLDRSAEMTAEELRQSPRSISPEEHAGMVVRAAQLVNERAELMSESAKLYEGGNTAAAEALQPRLAAIGSTIDKITEGIRYGRRETSRALGIGRLQLFLDDLSKAPYLESVRVRAKRALSAEETAKFTKLADDYEALKKEHDALSKKASEQADALQKATADRQLKVESRKRSITQATSERKARLRAERTDLMKQLAALGYRMNTVIGPSPEALKIIGKLAANIAEEGFVSASDVAQKIVASFPEITAQDVYRAVTLRTAREQNAARREASRRVRELKTQSRLLLQLDSAEKGVFDAPNKAAPPSGEVSRLRKTLRDLRTQAYQTATTSDKLEGIIQRIEQAQEMLEQQSRPLRKPRAAEPQSIADTRKTLNELRREMRVEDELADVENQLKTGDFKPVETKPVREKNPALEQKEIALARQRRLMSEERNRLGPISARRVVNEAIAFPKTMMATADMSAALRQGLWLSVRRPLTAGTAFVKAAKAFFSEHAADQIDASIRSSPNQFLRDRAKLFLSELGMKTTKGEEYFLSRLAQRIPGFGRIVKASERNMVSFLNLLRSSVFDQFAEANPNATRAELAKYADYINKATGRGSLGSFEGASTLLNTFAFAPRFAVSRFQTPLTLLKYLNEPRIRKEIAKDMAAFIGVVGSSLALAHYAGAEVSTDPRSSDFLKIKTGNTRYDISGGFGPALRLMMRLAVRGTDEYGLTGKHLPKSKKEIDPIDMLSRFAAFKLAPSVTIPYELATRKNVVGARTTPGETVARAVMPILASDILEAYRSGGLKAALPAAAASFVGVGVNTYKKKAS